MSGQTPPYGEGLRSPQEVLGATYQALQSRLLVAPYNDSHNVSIPLNGTDLVAHCSDYDAYLHNDSRDETDPAFDVIASRARLLQEGRSIVAITLRTPGQRADEGCYILVRPGDVNRYDGMLGSYTWAAMSEKPEAFTDWDPECVIVLDMTNTGEALPT